MKTLKQLVSDGIALFKNGSDGRLLNESQWQTLIGDTYGLIVSSRCERQAWAQGLTSITRPKLSTKVAVFSYNGERGSIQLENATAHTNWRYILLRHAWRVSEVAESGGFTVEAASVPNGVKDSLLAWATAMNARPRKDVAKPAAKPVTKPAAATPAAKPAEVTPVATPAAS